MIQTGGQINEFNPSDTLSDMILSVCYPASPNGDVWTPGKLVFSISTTETKRRKCVYQSRCHG